MAEVTGRACWRGGTGDGGMGDGFHIPASTGEALALLGQGGGLIWGTVKGKLLLAPQKLCPQVGVVEVPSTKGLPQPLSRGRLHSPLHAPAGFLILARGFL